MVIAGELDEPRTRDVPGQVARRLPVNDPIADSMQHQGGRLDLVQQRPRVSLERRFKHHRGIRRAGPGALVAGPPLSELLISPWGPELRESPLPPAGIDALHQLADSRSVETPRIARCPVKAGLRAAQHKGLHAFWIRDCEQDSQRAALTGA